MTKETEDKIYDKLVEILMMKVIVGDNIKHKQLLNELIQSYEGGLND